MAKRVSDAELAEMKELGEIKYDPESREIARFGELIEKLEQMIAANAERTRADLAQAQVQLEVIGNLQKLIRAIGTKSQVSGETMDMQPIHALLEELTSMAHTHEPVPYKFHILRAGENGPMMDVIATPIEPTRH